VSSRKQQKRANQLVRAQRARERRRRMMIWTTIAVVAVLVIGGVTGYTIYAVQQNAKNAGKYSMPKGSTKDDLGLVASNGSVPVDLYVDFMCPHCQEFEQTASSALNQFVQSGKIRLVYHPVNILDSDSSGTEYSTRAAAAAACASDAGQLTEYVTALYAKQPQEGSSGLTDQQIIDYAKSGGVTAASFPTCVKSGKYKKWVSHVTDQFTQKGYTGTPTVVVNGTQLQDTSVDALTKAINAA
jgi:protein-disulfide isomerase